MTHKPSPTAIILTVALLASALAPGMFADSVALIDISLLSLCFGKALRPREQGALAAIACACIALIVARSVTNQYFVTPWQMGRALLRD